MQLQIAKLVKSGRSGENRQEKRPLSIPFWSAGDPSYPRVSRVVGWRQTASLAIQVGVGDDGNAIDKRSLHGSMQDFRQVH